MLDSCPFLFHTVPANYTQRCNPKFLHLICLDQSSPAFAASKGQAATRSDVPRRHGLESSKERGHESNFSRKTVLSPEAGVGWNMCTSDRHKVCPVERQSSARPAVHLWLIEALKEGKVRDPGLHHHSLKNSLAIHCYHSPLEALAPQVESSRDFCT